MATILEVLAMVIVGPLVGSELAIAAFVHPLAGRLGDDAFRTVRVDGARLLGKVMPFWYFASFVPLVAAAVVAHSWLLGGAAALMVAVIVVTVAVMVPINNRIAAWPAHDVDRELAARWDRLHWLRVAALAALWALVAAARFG